MYLNLLGPVKSRLLRELQDSFSRHPKYTDMVPNIQNKSSFKERPSKGIILKGASGSKIQLSSQNYLGANLSHVMLTQVGVPGQMVEWAREDSNALVLNQGVMPTLPGVYYLQCASVPTTAAEEGTYFVDPLLTVSHEPVLRFVSGLETEATLAHVPVEDTLRLYLGRYLLEEGIDFSYDKQTVTLLTSNSPGALLSADYRYIGDTLGPIKWMENSADFTTLPGVVLAFGRRAKVGDVQAVVVTASRSEAAKVHGGLTEMTFDLEVIAKDSETQEELADLIFMYLWSEKRDYLSHEGLEVTDVSLGGEGEEVYDVTAGNSYFTASVSVAISANWEVYIPNPLTLTKTNPSGPGSTAVLDGALLPTVVGRSVSFERII